MKIRSTFVLACLVAAFGLSAQLPLKAALLFYDGFAAGGATPGIGQYQTSPASTTGANNDALGGQAPVAHGFADSAWRISSVVASTVYGRATATDLSYTGMPTVAGAANIFRSGKNSISQLKQYFRDFAPTTGAGASTLYFSSLLQFTANTPGTFAVSQSAESSTISFGFTSAGNLAVDQSTGITGGISASTYLPGTTYLLVAKIYNTNLVDVWLNPTDLSSEAGSSSQKVITGAEITAGGFTLGTAITDLRLSSDTGNNVSDPSFVFDEIRGATTWGESLTAVPEPSVSGISLLAGLVLLGRRRR